MGESRTCVMPKFREILRLMNLGGERNRSSVNLFLGGIFGVSRKQLEQKKKKKNRNAHECPWTHEPRSHYSNAYQQVLHVEVASAAIARFEQRERLAHANISRPTCRRHLSFLHLMLFRAGVGRLISRMLDTFGVTNSHSHAHAVCVRPQSTNSHWQWLATLARIKYRQLFFSEMITMP